MIRQHSDFTIHQVIANEPISPRMYSITSGENNDNIKISYLKVPNGLLTEKLWNLKPGNKIFISEPYGKFVTNSGPAWFIATVTGIAPYISLILSGYADNKILIHGSRSIKDFYFNDLLERNLNERYIRCYTGIEENEFFRGRVTEYLCQHEKMPTDNKYYLCCSAEMVVDTRQILIDQGIPFQNILSEIYF